MACTRSLSLVLLALGSCSGGSDESAEFVTDPGASEVPNTDADKVARSSSYQMLNQSVSMVGTVQSSPSSQGGITIPLGGGAAQLRLTLDAAGGRLELGVFDGAGAVPIRIKQPEIALRITAGEETFDLRLAASGNQATGETAGRSSSTFSKRDPRLEGLETFHVDITSIAIGDREFREIGVEY